MATSESINLQRIIPFIVKMGPLQVHAWLGVLKTVAFNFFIGFKYVYHWLEAILHTDKNIIQMHSLPIQIFNRDRDLSEI